MIKYFLIAGLIATSCILAKSTNSILASNNEIKDFRKICLVDTTNFIKENIINKKEKYVGKPLNNMLVDIPYSIMSYVICITQYRKLTEGITLSFKSADATTLAIIQKTNPILLTILWATPVPTDSAFSLRSKSKGAWLDKDQKYFGNKIIKDIILTDWGIKN